MPKGSKSGHSCDYPNLKVKGTKKAVAHKPAKLAKAGRQKKRY